MTRSRGSLHPTRPSTRHRRLPHHRTRAALDTRRALVRLARGRRSVTPLHLAVAALASLACLVLILAPLAYATGGDPFGGITQTINSNARNWAGALIIMGLLGVCIRYYFGDSDASQHTRGFLWGSIAAIAAGLGLAVYDWLSRYVVIR